MMKILPESHVDHNLTKAHVRFLMKKLTSLLQVPDWLWERGAYGKYAAAYQGQKNKEIDALWEALLSAFAEAKSLDSSKMIEVAVAAVVTLASRRGLPAAHIEKTVSEAASKAVREEYKGR